MIDPREADVGRQVAYRVPGTGAIEYGVITRVVDGGFVFVRYGRDVKATLKQSLSWVDHWMDE